MKKFLLGSIIALAFFGCGSGGGSSTNVCSDKAIAYEEFQEFVKIYLKSPSSAIFREEPYSHAVDDDNCIHTINTLVESQNSFGGMVKSYVDGAIRYDKEREDWLLYENLNFY